MKSITDSGFAIDDSRATLLEMNAGETPTSGSTVQLESRPDLTKKRLKRPNDDDDGGKGKGKGKGGKGGGGKGGKGNQAKKPKK